jgi:catechol 2,3-dioxygenase
VHLKVSDLSRSIGFYTTVFDMQLMQRLGDDAAFLSWDGYHHHLGLNTWMSRGGAPAPRSAPGLFHVAFLYPGRMELARALRRVLDHDVPLLGAADHGVSEAVYLEDPDGNGIEMYRDRPREEWPVASDSDSLVDMVTEPLDLPALLALAT